MLQAQVTEEQAKPLPRNRAKVAGTNRPSPKSCSLAAFRWMPIHPFPKPSDAEEARTVAFLGKLREFLDTIDGSVIERDAQIPDEYVKGLAELGCFGMKIPSEYGGLNMSQVAYNRALLMVSTVNPSLGALLSAHQSIGVPEPLKLAGTPEQKREFLPRCAAGAISAFLLTEPDVGSDPARLGSTATPVEDGRAYEVEGVKLWTTNGVVAELLVVMARCPR
jgi:alkylation response protein AidB-like acyl-CoA dehydrogenase